MEKVNGYLAADGSFFAVEDECVQYEREQLRFFAISQRLEVLLQPSMTGQIPDVKPEIIEILESAGAWNIDSELCSFLMHIRYLLNDTDNHDQLDAVIGVITYLIGG